MSKQHRFFRDGNEYIHTEMKSPPGFKGVLVIAKCWNPETSSVRETCFTADQLKGMSERLPPDLPDGWERVFGIESKKEVVPEVRDRSEFTKQSDPKVRLVKHRGQERWAYQSRKQQPFPLWVRFANVALFILVVTFVAIVCRLT